MKWNVVTGLLLLFSPFSLCAQEQDSLDNERLAKMVSLSEVILRTDLNIPSFIDRVKKDTTFYKAFRNLHLLGFTAWNDIRIRDKKGNLKASLVSKTKQIRSGNCRSMEIVNEKTSGDFYDNDGGYNYNTGEMYGGLFFTKGSVCGESNIVKGVDFRPKSESGIEKRKAQLKMLFFNPGKKIPGIPFIGDKIDIFDPDKARYYDYIIDYGDYEGSPCYVFSIKAKPDLDGGERHSIVIDSMITWFNAKTMEVMARNYDMSYDAGVYDFDVHMEVQMTKFGNYLVPKLLRYIGNWDVVFKKRERGTFTATLFDFTQ
ncbi:MAG: hypothetical protein ABI688_03520 [Bacteroidota bacterium]